MSAYFPLVLPTVSFWNGPPQNAAVADWTTGEPTDGYCSPLPVLPLDFLLYQVVESFALLTYQHPIADFRTSQAPSQSRSPDAESPSAPASIP